MTSNWVTAKLKDCFKLRSGENITAKLMVPGDYEVFGGNGVAGTHHKFNLSGDNVIIGRVGALCGNARHITAEIWLTDNAFKIVDKKYDFDNKFLTYLLNFKELRSLARQAAQPVISNSSLAELSLSFPESLDEQKRIVAILDQAFADIDKARETAEKNLANAKELFDSYLREAFKDCAKSSTEYRWAEVVEIRSGKNQKAVEDENGAYPIIGSAGKVMGYANSFICEENTTVIGRKGTINSPKFIKEKFWNVDTAFGLHAGPKLNSLYLFYFCRSYDFTKHDKGSGRPSLVKGDLSLINMPVPNLDIQHEMVRKIDLLVDQVGQLEEIYKDKIRSLDELKSSILNKAFSGELKNSKGAA